MQHVVGRPATRSPSTREVADVETDGLPGPTGSPARPARCRRGRPRPASRGRDQHRDRTTQPVRHMTISVGQTGRRAVPASPCWSMKSASTARRGSTIRARNPPASRTSRPARTRRRRKCDSGQPRRLARRSEAGARPVSEHLPASESAIVVEHLRRGCGRSTRRTLPARESNGPAVHARVTCPPASSTMSAPAAMSQGLSSASQKPSKRPAAT